MNSMTGFGRAKLESEQREYIIDIKSVNHKYSDITVKLPRDLFHLEDRIRKAVLNRISRGKVDVFVSFENNGLEGKNIFINKELAKKYIQELTELTEETQIASELKVTEIAKLPDVLNIQSDDESSEKIWRELSECLENALDNFIEMRNLEGSKIKQDLSRRIDKVSQNVEKICEYSTGLVEEYIVKLETRIKELMEKDIIDETRVMQEAVIYADKCSIEEEITRLLSHINQFRSLIQDEKPCGKKLDFLIQEMNREINTIGSKSGKLEITNLVIDTKVELEDIREQIQNIE